MEAEYIAMTECAKDVIWIKNFLNELKLIVPIVEINCDNTSAIAISKNGRFNSRAKHIDLRAHFIRDLVRDKIVNLKYIGTNDNIADVMTKVV